MNENIKQCCTFWVNGYLFGLDVLQVREIVEHQRSTPVPLSSETVDGLINLRGEIVTSIDLRKRFPRESSKESDRSMNIVVMNGDEAISLVVDEVGDVIDIASEKLEPTPDTLRAEVRDMVGGVYKMDSQLMLVLDVTAAVSVAEQI